MPKLEPFRAGQDIEAFLEKAEQFYIAQGFTGGPNSTKRKALLLSALDDDVYLYLKDTFAPVKVAEKSYKDISEALKDRYAPKRLRILERFKFHSAVQMESESVTDFAARLRKLSAHCGFGELKETLRDRLVCGLRNVKFQKELLATEKNFEEVLNTVQSMEIADREVPAMQSPRTGLGSAAREEPEAENVNQVRRNPSAAAADKKGEEQRTKPCWRCGGRRHAPSDCRFKGEKCWNCLELGHVKIRCRKPAKVVNAVTSDVAEGESNGDIFTLSETKGNGALRVNVKLDQVPVIMEVDTGCGPSIIPRDVWEKKFERRKLEPCSVKLSSFGGTSVPVLGQFEALVELDNQARRLSVLVVEAPVSTPLLLGRDWMSEFKMDVTRIMRLGNSRMEELLSEFGSVFESGLGTVQGVTASLSLKEGAEPKFYKARQVPFALREAVDEEICRMEREGILEKVEHSEWATPIVCVPKQNGKVRVCGDYKVTLNPQLNVDQHPLPSPESMFSQLAGGKIFSKIDLAHAYQQLLLDDKSREYVTINTNRGLYRYTRLPYGVASSPAIFQRFMDTALVGLSGVTWFMDDILVTGETDEIHWRNLCDVFRRLDRYGLRVNPDKCNLFQSEVVYMGFNISAEGVSPTAQKVEAIRDAPNPQNVSELRTWLGMLQYVGKCIPNLSSVVAPLNQLLKQGAKFRWSKSCQEAFDRAKELLVGDNVLAHYDPKLPLILSVDASMHGLGATLSHKYENGSERIVMCVSRSLNSAERNYSQVEKEALAIIFGVSRFRTYLYGRKFLLRTDHKSLVRIFGPKTGIPVLAASRLQRWAIILACYDYEIEYIPSQKNVTADCLSRLPLASQENTVEEAHAVFGAGIESDILENLPVSSSAVAKETKVDAVLSRVLYYTKVGWPDKVDDVRLQPYFHRRFELTIEQNCLLWGIRVIIPSKLQSYVLDELHCAHPGIVRMKATARNYVWWSNMDKDIEILARHCESCATVRSRPTVAPMQPWLWPLRPWQRVHVDFCEKDGKHFLLLVDAHSKWPEIVHMKSTNAEATCDVLRDLFARFGLVEQIVSDNGPPFQSETFSVFCKNNGIKHVRVSSYHPASNGAVERLVQSFKNYLKSSRKDNLSVSQLIARFLLTYRNTEHATTNVSPAQLFLGRELRTRLSLLRPSVESNVQSKQADHKQKHDQTSKFREFFVGDEVLVCDVRKNEWLNGVIAERSGPLSYVVTLADGRVWRKHVDHIKRCSVHRDVSDVEYEKEYDFSRSVHNPRRENVIVERNDNSNGVDDNVELRRSTRVRNQPKCLIEEM